MELARIGVVGAGQMGNGIAQVAASAGYDVVMQDVSAAGLAKGLATIDKNLAGWSRRAR
jgi:3-hydroxybutyryl-CoA dehydrogenase